MNGSTLLIIIGIAVMLLAVAGFLIARRRPSAGAPTPKDSAEPTAEPSARSQEAPTAAPAAPAIGKGTGLGAKVRALFGSEIAEQDRWAQLEEVLIRADVGPKGASDLVERLRKRYRDGDDVEDLLVEQITDVLDGAADLDLDTNKPAVLMIVGVNGSGKTTTIGKLARRLADQGRKVTLAASDTFRAAAGEQLETWAERSGAELVSSERGADPGAVAFDGVKAAEAGGSDVVLIDTAGRLHTKTPLMEELSKVRRVVEKAAGHAPDEVLLVLDGTTGQNGIAQARSFTDAVGVTGVVLTKMDGSAKGGIVLAVREELGVVVKLVGTGEGAGDLAPFDAAVFAENLVRG